MYVWRALAVLFVIAVPLLFICSSVTYAFNEMRLYSYGFDKYDISRRTGISDEGLMDSARTIRGYFNSPSSPLVLTGRGAWGGAGPLYHARVGAHGRC